MKDLGEMFKKAQELQSKLEDFQNELETLEVLCQSGGGLVTVTLNGKGALRRVTIDPSLLKPEEVEILEDLLVAAHADAKGKVEQRATEQAEKMSVGMGLPPGFKLPL